MHLPGRTVWISRRGHPPSRTGILPAGTTTPGAPVAWRYHLKDRAELMTACGLLKQSGVEELHYIPREHLLGVVGQVTTDGSHPNDAGFMRQAGIFVETFGPLLREVR
jgi:GDSL-like Lipase/Acylhydrolase family